MSIEHAHLDAETLAAWMDGGLDASSSAAAEAHVSNCDRCQAMVATFVRTEPLATGTAAPGTLSSWRWWLAPIAATAVAVTIWMVMPPQTPEPAATRESAAELEAKSAAPSAPAEQQAQAVNSQQKLADNPVSARAPSAELRRDRLAGNRQQDQAPATAADRAAKLENLPQRAEAGFSKPAAEEARATAPAPPGALAETVTVAPSAPPELAAPPRPVVQKRLGPFEIVSPSPAFRWRVDAQGSIERSEDGGRAWLPIRLGTGESLTAGSSPSQHVCWLVGGRGVVLIAVDGVSFVRLPFPHEVDLVAVAATDGRTATVTSADGRTFTTTDTGRTWR